MTRHLLVPLSALLLAVGTLLSGDAFAQSAPVFKLGFKALADQIPDIVGEPVEDEQYAPGGDSLQRSTNGLMVWRKADNWTAFTNGSRTWVLGPGGAVYERSNDGRFDWETPATPAASSKLGRIPADAMEARVIRVIDGVTVDVEVPGQGIKRVRYIGIETQEAADDGRPVQYGAEAAKKNKELVDGQTVYLEKDVSDTDRYGQLLCYVYLADGRMVNEELIRLGYVRASSYPPDIRYQEHFRELEREASEASVGFSGPVSRQSPSSTATPAASATGGLLPVPDWADKGQPELDDLPPAWRRILRTDKEQCPVLRHRGPGTSRWLQEVSQIGDPGMR